MTAWGVDWSRGSRRVTESVVIKNAKGMERQGLENETSEYVHRAHRVKLHVVVQVTLASKLLNVVGDSGSCWEQVRVRGPRIAWKFIQFLGNLQCKVRWAKCTK